MKNWVKLVIDKDVVATDEIWFDIKNHDNCFIFVAIFAVLAFKDGKVNSKGLYLPSGDWMWLVCFISDFFFLISCIYLSKSPRCFQH